MQRPGEIILEGKVRVRKLSMLLYQGSGYRVKNDYVEIIGGVRLRIIGLDRRYDDYENGGGKASL
jgi:hypothetical protein